MSEIKKYRYIFAALFTILIFMTGILTSNLIDDKRQSALQDSLADNAADMQSKQLLMTYLDDSDSCDLRKDGLNQIVADYNDRLDRVQSYEENSFFQAKSYENLKRRYVLSGLEYWMFAENTEENCADYNTNTVLFFTDEDCEDCSRQGEVLTDLKRIHGEELLVFVVYTDIKDSMIGVLRDQYQVEEPPAIVINKNTTFNSVASRQNITEQLDLESENSS